MEIISCKNLKSKTKRSSYHFLRFLQVLVIQVFLNLIFSVQYFWIKKLKIFINFTKLVKFYLQKVVKNRFSNFF